MQRLTGWFDQLTLRRSRRSRATSRASSERRVASHSVAPSCRLNEENQKRQLKPVNIPFVFPPPPTNSQQMSTSSFTRRKGIRTNPWLYNSHLPPDHGIVSPTAYSLQRPAPPPYLGVKHMDESTCSSGYGSQDCSPNSSINFSSWHSASPHGTWKSSSPDTPGQTGGSWKDANSGDVIDDDCFLEESSSFSTYDNICDEHIYHELELICRRPDRSYSSDCISVERDSPQPRPDFPRAETRVPRALPRTVVHAPRDDSPIYAQPWTTYSAVTTPLVVRNQSFNPNTESVTTHRAARRRLPARPASPIYATPYTGPMASPRVEENAMVYPGSFFNRLDRSRSRCRKEEKVATSLEEAEEEFLTELDAQINELQQRSEDLRNLVEMARVRRGNGEWTRPIMECTFELDI